MNRLFFPSCSSCSPSPSPDVSSSQSSPTHRCTSLRHKLCDWMNQVDLFCPRAFNIIYTTQHHRCIRWWQVLCLFFFAANAKAWTTPQTTFNISLSEARLDSRSIFSVHEEMPKISSDIFCREMMSNSRNKSNVWTGALLSDCTYLIIVEHCRPWSSIWFEPGRQRGKDGPSHLGQSVGKTPVQEILQCGSIKSHHWKEERPRFSVKLEMNLLDSQLQNCIYINQFLEMSGE